MDAPSNSEEWYDNLFLESNGLGGYACCTIGGVRLWPSQGLVAVAKTPPVGRYVLLSSFDVWVDFGEESIPLSTNRFEENRYEPDGRRRITSFEANPWPKWIFDLGKDRSIHFELFSRNGTNQFVYSWYLAHAREPAVLRIRPLLAGRPMNSPRPKVAPSKMPIRPERPQYRQFLWKLRPGSPGLVLLSDGEFTSNEEWIEGFAYDNSSKEDLACPGEFRWEVAPRKRVHVIACTAHEIEENPRTANEVAHLANKLKNAERMRRKLFRSPLDRAADCYIVAGSDGKTVISGFPRGTERGTQTMIALRGICLSPGRLDVARAVLKTWRGRLAGGLLPSEISEHRLQPTFQSPEPSLWYIIAAYEYFRAVVRQNRDLKPEECKALSSSITRILDAFVSRRHKEAYMDEDGLLGEDRQYPEGENGGEITKRAHVQALWINALWVGSGIDSKWQPHYLQAKKEFTRTFWSEKLGYLYPSIFQSPSRAIRRVESFGMEQILAVGGLPLISVDEAKASLIVQLMENRYATSEVLRKAKSFPWYFGPLVEAAYRIRHRESTAEEDVKHRFLDRWEAHLQRGGLGHLPDDQSFPEHEGAPKNVRQTPFSAIETAEFLRLLHLPGLQRGPDPFDDEHLEPLFQT